VYTLAITRVSTRTTLRKRKRHGPVRVLTFVGRVSQRMIPSPNHQHRITTSGLPDHSCTRSPVLVFCDASRGFPPRSPAGKSKVVRWISRRHTRLGALAPIVDVRRPRRRRRGWSERVSGVSRIGRSFRSHADRVQARSLSLVFPLLFISTSYLDFPSLAFPSCRRRAFVPSSPVVRATFQRRLTAQCRMIRLAGCARTPYSRCRVPIRD